MTEAPVISKLRNPSDVIRYSNDVDLTRAKDFYACPPYGVILGEFERIGSLDVHYPITVRSNVLRSSDNSLNMVFYHTYSHRGELLIPISPSSDRVTGVDSYFIIDRSIEVVKAKLRIHIHFVEHHHRHKKPTFKLAVLKSNDEDKWVDYKFSTQSLKLDDDDYIFSADLTSLITTINHSREFDDAVEVVDVGLSNLSKEVEESFSELRRSESESLLVPLDKLRHREELQMMLFFGYPNGSEFIEWLDSDSYLSLATLEGEQYGSRAVSALCNVFSGITSIHTSDSSANSSVQLNDSTLLTSKSCFDLFASTKLEFKSLVQRATIEKSIPAKKPLSFGQLLVSPIDLQPNSVTLFDFSFQLAAEPDVEAKLIRCHIKDEPFIASVLPSTVDGRFVVRFQFTVDNSSSTDNLSFSPELIIFNKSKLSTKFSLILSSINPALAITIRTI